MLGALVAHLPVDLTEAVETEAGAGAVWAWPARRLRGRVHVFFVAKQTEPPAASSPGRGHGGHRYGAGHRGGARGAATADAEAGKAHPSTPRTKKNEREAAATMIQARFRGKKERETAAERRAAKEAKKAEKTAAAEAKKAAQEAEKQEQDAAAAKIQARFRGRQVRKKQAAKKSLRKESYIPGLGSMNSTMNSKFQRLDTAVLADEQDAAHGQKTPAAKLTPASPSKRMSKADKAALRRASAMSQIEADLDHAAEDTRNVMASRIQKKFRKYKTREPGEHSPSPVSSPSDDGTDNDRF